LSSVSFRETSRLMPNAKRKKQKKGKKSKASINPSESVVIYRGPLKLPLGSQERQKITTVCHYGPTVLTAGSGAIGFVVSDDPSGAVDWASLATIWDEYRVLGFTFNFHPYNRYNQNSANTTGPLFTVIDRDDGTVLTTEAQCLEFESLIVYNIDSPFKREIYSMTAIEDASFITTATPVARTWFKLVGTGLTSISYGKYWITHMIQFRGRN